MTDPTKYGVKLDAKSTAAKYAGLFDALLSMGTLDGGIHNNVPMQITRHVPLYPAYVPKTTIELILGSIRQKIRNHRKALAKLGNCDIGEITQYQVRAKSDGVHWYFHIVISPSPTDVHKLHMAAAKLAYKGGACDGCESNG